MSEKSIPYEQGAALTGQPIQFKIPLFLGLKTTLEIKPLKPGAIVRIGMEKAKMQPVEGDLEGYSILYELFTKSENIVYTANIIAHAIINQNIFKRWKFRYYRWLMLNCVEDMQHLWMYTQIVFKQSDPSRFFFIMELAEKMDYLMKKQTVPTTEPKLKAV